jgi:predicted DCC family thiol-disulfide oxidoreductase YuxK
VSVAAHASAVPRQELVVLMDGQCPMCRRIGARLRALDRAGRLIIADGSDAEVRDRHAPGLDEATALAAMHVVMPDGARYAGYDGFLHIARVIPLLWPLWLLGRLPFAGPIGRFAYRYIAANRRRDGRCSDLVCMR